jgi:hypothetical protein
MGFAAQGMGGGAVAHPSASLVSATWAQYLSNKHQGLA